MTRRAQPPAADDPGGPIPAADDLGGPIPVSASPTRDAPVEHPDRPGDAAEPVEGPRREARRPGARALIRVVPALVFVAVALAGPWLAPEAIDQPVVVPYEDAGADGAPLGGDQIGRDVWSRLLVGGRELIVTSLVVALAVTALGAVLGTVGALRPRLGRLLERAADVLMLLPAVLGILLLTLSWPDGGRSAVIAAAVCFGTPYAVRFVAAAAAPVATTGYVEAAVAGGERLWHLVVREVLPNLRATVLALFGLRFVAAVHVVATAGFLQVGPQPPAADWALMIRENAPGILLNPWAVVAPSIAIGLLAMSVNLTADALAPRAGRKAAVVR
ncbi:ABC transporter permease [Streptomyces sp. SAJ15]|uniref:ABC transporter permease n=1 Tax=Streptomyces sp. SAJ15 TaxID=2011095 RepID=UPI001185AD2F|nr:ABC transporter permease [Streptomyces sp. SAJ15]TVL91360.1 ABC transporter permease [Streptomyces sp. SAJ15]